MIDRILLAVDDSPPSLAAARLAVDLSAAMGARLHAIHVRPGGVEGDGPAPAASAGDGPGRAPGSRTDESPVLHYVARLAQSAAVPCETAALDGDVTARILEQAQAIAAGLIVLGGTDPRRAGEPYVGHYTRHVLEFAERPVLVVPGPGRPAVQR